MKSREFRCRSWSSVNMKTIFGRFSGQLAESAARLLPRIAAKIMALDTVTIALSMVNDSKRLGL